MKISKLYIENTGLTASHYDPDAVNQPPIFFSYCLDPDLTPSCVNSFLAVTCNLLLTALVTPSFVISQKYSGTSRVTFYPPLCQYVTPSPPKHDAVRYYFQLDLETLPFSSLFAPKMSKMLSFPDFFSKVPKMTKGTI